MAYPYDRTATPGSTPSDRTALVIGAGPGGLASAMLLAASGVRVKVIDRLNRIGGRTSTLSSTGDDYGFAGPTSDAGYRFDMGPTFFLYPRILEEVFEACGADLRKEIELVRLDPQYRLTFEDAAGRPGGGEHVRFDCTPDVRRMQREIAQLSPRDAEHFPAFIAENRRKFAAFAPILQRPFEKLTDCLSAETLRALPLIRPWASVDGDLKRFFSDERVRLAFSFQSKYLGMSPFNCPSLFTILSYLEYDYGVYHPIGGCGAVSRAMARVARGMGVEFLLGDEVEEVLIDDSRQARRRAANGRPVVRGVRSRSGEHTAHAVVLNADFAHAMTRLVPDRYRRRWTDHKLAKKKYSCSTFMMYLGLDGPPQAWAGGDQSGPGGAGGAGGVSGAHHNIFLTRDYVQNLDDIENRHRLSDNPSFYVCNPGLTDPTLAPKGKTALYVLVPVSHENPNVDWSREQARYRAKAIEQLGKLGMGSPGQIERHIEFEKVVTPSGWRDDMAIHRGATFNLAHSLDQMLTFRPHNRFEDLANAYLVGGGTHPGSGLPVIYESARITARLLLKDWGIEVDWPNRGVQIAELHSHHHATDSQAHQTQPKTTPTHTLG